MTQADRSGCGRRSGSALEQTGDAQILVDLIPMDTHSVTQQLPMVALSLSCMEEARKPGERYRNLATIDQ
jgi:hypothetical protein